MVHKPKSVDGKMESKIIMKPNKINPKIENFSMHNLKFFFEHLMQISLLF